MKPQLDPDFYRCAFWFLLAFSLFLWFSSAYNANHPELLLLTPDR